MKLVDSTKPHRKSGEAPPFLFKKRCVNSYLGGKWEWAPLGKQWNRIIIVPRTLVRTWGTHVALL